MKKEIKVEWCENFIKSVFEKIPFEINLFWDKAEKSGLWVRGTYGSPMSKALEKLVKVEILSDYTVFRLR